MRERVAYQLKLDAVLSLTTYMNVLVLKTILQVRRAMPAELVDKSRIFYSAETDYMDKRRAVDSREPLMEGNADALTEEEIDRVLEDAEEDSELTIIRRARLEELMELSKLNVNRGQEQVKSGQGEVQASDPAGVLRLITSGDRVVILVTREEADLSPSQGELSTGILKNMKALAKEFLGTSFLFCVLDSKFGDDLRSRLQISQLPALICCREGVIVSRVMGTALRQFVLMETLGSVIFQAWLNQACILCKSNKECPLVGETEHQRRSRSCASEDSNDQSDSDSDGVNDSDTSDETNFKASPKNDMALGPKTFAR